MPQEAVDVFVAGAGPVGLLLAGQLRAFGVSCRIVEQRRERSPYSKAMTLHARTLEVLDLAGDGLVDRFVRRGYSASGLTMTTGAGAPVRISMDSLPTRFPFLLMLHQAETEQLLEDWLTEQDATVEYGRRLIALDRTDNGVIAEVTHDDGSSEHIAATWLVGCDGGRSTVRDTAGFEFDRSDYAPIGMIADVRVGGGPAALRGRITQFSARRGFVNTLPFRDGWIRFHVIDHADQDRSADDPLTLDELQAAVDRVLPFPVVLSDPRWMTRFVSTVAHVPAYRSGRVLVAGDAAHLHSPAEGGGMNLGLQDAGNLAWKLALVTRGLAGEELLDTYTDERHAVAAAAAKRNEMAFRAALLRSPIAVAARDLAMRTVARVPAVQRTMREQSSGIGIDYRHAPWASAPNGAFTPRRVSRPGDRVPDVDLVHLDGTPTRLYALLRDPTPLVLVSVALDLVMDGRDNLHALLGELDAQHRHVVRVAVVLDEGIPEVLDVDVPVLIDRGRRYTTALDASHGDAVLVRPDAHVGARSAFFDARPIVAAAGAHGLGQAPTMVTAS